MSQRAAVKTFPVIIRHTRRSSFSQCGGNVAGSLLRCGISARLKGGLGQDSTLLTA
jgi:hypothetical protein